jgi:hypothetical protein
MAAGPQPERASCTGFSILHSQQSIVLRRIHFGGIQHDHRHDECWREQIEHLVETVEGEMKIRCEEHQTSAPCKLQRGFLESFDAASGTFAASERSRHERASAATHQRRYEQIFALVTIERDHAERIADAKRALRQRFDEVRDDFEL